MLPVWISHHNDIDLLRRQWYAEFEKRALGGALALSGFHYQFLVTLHDTLQAWLARSESDRNTPAVFSEFLSDIFERSPADVIIVSQVKRTTRTDSFQDALTELWLIYDLALRVTPSLVPYLRFRILSRKTELKDHEKTLQQWYPSEQAPEFSVETFRGKVTVHVFSNPEDEILGLLANDFKATDPSGYVQRWLGELLAAASKSPTGFEEAAKSIWNDLQSLQHSSSASPQSIYIWTNGDSPPERIVEGDVLTGERPSVHHLRQGYFSNRPEVYRPLAERALEWARDVFDKQDKQLRLPVFWIGGRSGSGKSVALIHVLGLLYESGLGPVLWLGNKTELLRQAIPWALRLAENRRQIIIGIDDPYAPNTQSDDVIWKEALAVLEGTRQGGNATALPLIICCGPSEQAERMQNDLPEDVKVNVWELPEENQKDFSELRNWYVQRTKKIPPNVGDENVLLVQLFFEWETGQRLPEFASRFRDRIKESDTDTILEGVFTRMLCANRLYVGYPKQAISAHLTSNQQDTFHRLREEHHIAQTITERGIGLWLAHPHLSNVIYESWYPLHSNRAVRSDHLRLIIKDAIEFGMSMSEKMAPLWAISNFRYGSSERNPITSRLDQDSIEELLPLIYAQRTQDSGGRLTLAELPVWIQIRSVLPDARLGVDPVNGALSEIKIENLGERGLRLTCHKLLQHYDSFSDYQQVRVIDSISDLLAKAPLWHEWAPIADDAYRRTRNSRFITLITDWVNDHPRSRWASRLMISLLNDNSSDPRILNAIRGLLPRAGGELGWGDIAIRLTEKSPGAIPLPVLQWAQNNQEEWGVCFLLGYLLRRSITPAKKWAMVWCKNWHAQRLAHFVLEPLLAFTEPNEQVKDWCIRWIAADHEIADSSFLIEKLIKAFQSDPEVMLIGLRWLETNDIEHPSWSFVWRAIYQVNWFEIFAERNEEMLGPLPITTGHPAGSEPVFKAAYTLTNLIRDDPRVWYYLALGLGKLRLPEEGVQALIKATEIDPQFGPAWQKLSAFYNRTGQTELALEAALNLTGAKPDDPEAWYYLSIAYYKAGQLDNQLASLIRATELDPKSVQAWQALASIYSDLGQTELALSATLNIAVSITGDPAAWYRLSRIYGKIENYQEEITALLKVTELDPGYAKAWQRLGAIYNRLGQTELALKANKKLSELRPEDPQAWYHLSIAYGKTDRYEDQIAALKRASELDANSAKTLYYMAMAYGKAERYEEQVTALLKVIDLDPQFIEAWWVLGAAYTQLGQKELALSATLMLTELDPNDPESWYYLAIAYSNLDRRDEEVAALIRATELNPDYADAWRALGATANRVGKTELRMTATLRLIELKPDDPEAWYYLAIAFSEVGRRDDEISALVRATELKPDYADAWLQLGATYNGIGNYQRAREATLKLVGLKPDDPEAWYYLSIAEGRTGHTNEQIGALRKALELDPKLSQAWYSLSVAYERAGLFNEQVAALKKATESEPQRAESLDLLQRYYYRSGQYDLALEYLQKFLELKPGDAEGQYHLGLLLFRMRRFAEAASALEKATILAPGHTSAAPLLAEAIGIVEAFRELNVEPAGLDTREAREFYAIGNEYAESGEVVEALNSFQRAIEASTNELSAVLTLQQALLRKATVAFHSESYETAIILLKIVTTMDPDASDGWSFLSSAYRRLGRDEEALDASERLIVLSPTSAEAWYKLGKRYTKLGRINDAARAFNQVLALNENFNAARRELSALNSRLHSTGMVDKESE